MATGLEIPPPPRGAVFLRHAHSTLGALLDACTAQPLDEAYAYRDGPDADSVPALCVSTASAKDPTNPRAAPPGHSNVPLMTLVTADLAFWGVCADEVAAGTYRRSPAYRARKEAFTRACLRTFERAVFPHLRLMDHVVFAEAATPLTHARFTGAADGTPCGIAAVPSQLFQARIGPTSPIGGLFFCGGSGRAGSGVAGAMTSGVVAARAALGCG